MSVISATPQSIKKAGIVIQRGGLVAFPTETVYGLGADALNPLAVARIFEEKNRPRFDPIIVHINSFRDLERLCLKVDERAKILMERFWPGPLTLVLPKSSIVPDIVTAGLPTVAVRMPSHKIALELIKEAGTPIAAPSANLFGHLSPTTVEHVIEQIGSKVDPVRNIPRSMQRWGYNIDNSCDWVSDLARVSDGVDLILDGGKCPVGVESTVISLNKKGALLLRPGGLPLEDIEKVIGKVKIPKPNPKRPQSPGQLLHHYSPKTPLWLKTREIVFENLSALTGTAQAGEKKIGFLALTQPKETRSYEMVEVLSPMGDLREAAANLFSCLHRLDEAGLDIIYAEPVPERGLGRAIMDRLRRASGEHDPWRENHERNICSGN